MKIDSTNYMLLSKTDLKSIFARKFEKKATIFLADLVNRKQISC